MSTDTPNILLVMADQLAASALPIYGHHLVKTPNIESLAESGVTFESAYCNSPLCAPSRFSMLSGQLPSRIGAYDNAAEYPSSIPTIAHHLRAAGYYTCLAGKMHFVGADQLHGFEERITTDIYPADFGWTPNWERPELRYFWFHNMESVLEAGVYARTLALDFDEEVAFHAGQKLFDLAREPDQRPFFLTVSFTQPHDPYMVPEQYWSRYAHDDIDLPRIPDVPEAERDPHSQRLHELYDRVEYEVTEECVRNARHAYYGMVSYIDDQVGTLMRVLSETGLADNTVIIVTSDHGDMLGERGLWYKMNFFEDSARIPLIVHLPNRFTPRRVSLNVSLVDLFPTLLELSAGGEPVPNPVVTLDGRSLLPLMIGDEAAWPDTAYGEYLAEGTTQPILMIKAGHHKYIRCNGDPPQLFDLSKDPLERRNLAGTSEHADTETRLAVKAEEHWNTQELREQVLKSQRCRLLLHSALMRGHPTPWDHQPIRIASKLYNRNHAGELYDTDREARIPYRSSAPLRSFQET